MLSSIKAGAKLATGGAIPDHPGALYTPTVLTNVSAGMPAYEEELFGPVASVIRVRLPRSTSTTGTVRLHSRALAGTFDRRGRPHLQRHSVRPCHVCLGVRGLRRRRMTNGAASALVEGSSRPIWP